MKSPRLLTAVVFAALLGMGASAFADQDNAVSDAAARALAQSNAAPAAAPAATPAAAKPAAVVATPVATTPAPVTPAAAIVRCYRSAASGPDVEIVCPASIQDLSGK